MYYLSGQLGDFPWLIRLTETHPEAGLRLAHHEDDLLLVILPEVGPNESHVRLKIPLSLAWAVPPLEVALRTVCLKLVLPPGDVGMGLLSVESSLKQKKFCLNLGVCFPSARSHHMVKEDSQHLIRDCPPMNLEVGLPPLLAHPMVKGAFHHMIKDCCSSVEACRQRLGVCSLPTKSHDTVLLISIAIPWSKMPVRTTLRTPVTWLG